MKGLGNILLRFGSEQKQLIHKKASELLFVKFDAQRSAQFSVPVGVKPLFINEHNLPPNHIPLREYFLQFLVNLKVERTFAKDENEFDLVNKIDGWFDRFEKSLRLIFDSPELELVFDRKKYSFQINEPGKTPYDLNSLASGYSAIMTIVSELILQMERREAKVYDLEGTVLIDEIEAHLHVDLQKKILPFLTDFFPKIQFIVTIFNLPEG